MRASKYIFVLTVLCLSISFLGNAQEHPSLILTKEGVDKIRKELGNLPLFDASLEVVKQEVDAEISEGIDTPIPKDYSGGYTHERHKRNFLIAQKAGVLYQILQDEKYAKYIKDMLFQYESMYLDLPKHPQPRSYARGKLFWQCLNDSNWLVYMSQAYDCIYDYLSKKERKTLEKNLFKPFADYISIGNPQFFNRVHNHSTWGNAAVGMIGLVMNDDELVQRALYGIEDDGLEVGAKDNDGGFIKTEGQKTGFLANLEEPFSPDGYYTEGPYYQRYAMYPFLIFATGLNNVKPELKIFEHKDGVLLKSVNALLNLTDADGEFFPINDGQKGMSYHSRELVTAVDIAYHYGGQDQSLLSIAKEQGRVLLDDSGLSVASAIEKGLAEPFEKKSLNFKDGSNGDEGGLAILRAGEEETTLVFKYTAQGLSHGHYDKLSYSLYHEGNEVVQDYGLARFVNIEQKGGGNYLKENTSWAKQTIAHNTLVQNETSHFNGKYEIGSEHHSDLYFYDDSNPTIQIVSAKERNAYPSTTLHRTMALIEDVDFEHPIVIDLLRVTSDKENKYDLPFYFMGQLMQTNFEYDSPKILNVLGDANGYQHLYVEGSGTASGENSKLSWFNKGKFFTLTTKTTIGDKLLFTRMGANDPEFNLRREAGLLLRRENTKNTLFVSALETHGSYSPVSELAVNSYSNIEKLDVLVDTNEYTAIKIVPVKGKSKTLLVANKDASKMTEHNLNIDGENHTWSGPFEYK